MNTATPDPDLKVPGYRILRELGRGGMARVYLAVQESMEREVAIKVMLPALGAADPSFSERFLREARIVARLSHPHIIAVIDVGVAGPYHYYSMEYHTGGDLKARIHEGMMPKMALSIIRQVASALAFAHSKGYVHRDVKPENVIFRQDGNALLTDFGIAKAGDGASRMTATGAIIGTPHYMSPEQAQGTELDHRSDLYSLGVMLYEMMTGTVPYTGTTALSIGIKHLKEPVPVLPPPLAVYQPLFDRLLAKNANDRFQSGEEVVAAIDVMSSGAHPAISTATPTVIAGSGIAGNPTVVPTRTPETYAKTQISGTHAKTQLTCALAADGAGTRRGVVIAAALLVPVIAGGGYLLLRPAAVSPAPQAVAPAVSPAPADSKSSGVSAAGLTEPDTTARSQAAETHANGTKPGSDRKTATNTAPSHRPVPTPVVSASAPVTAAAAPRVNEAQDREQKLASMFARMQELLSPASLTATRAGLAVELYAEATKLAPSDARVRNAPGQIADAYLKLATLRADTKDYSEADNLIRKGLDLVPNHRLLAGLQKDIADKQKVKRQTFGGF